MDVCVRLLGRFELTCDGAVVIDGAWKPAKAAAIVKMLALRPGRSMHRDQVIAALWPDADIDAGTNSLYKVLHQLRQTVRRAGGPRDVIHLEHPTISLAPYVRVDVDEFRRRAAAIGAHATSADLAAALAVGGDALLPEDLYEPWTEPHRGDLQLMTSRLRLQLARAQVEASAFDDAIAQYRAVLATDDLSEEAHLGLMRAYAASDRRDLALRQYERCREVLSSELGTAPSAETEAFAAEIRRGDEKTRDEEAIDASVRAADAAMRRHEYPDAMREYRAAIERLRATQQDDRREAALLLKLAVATSGGGTQEEIADACRRAAQLAERAGAYDLLARALTQFQDATDSSPDNHAGHRESAELIEAALKRLPASEKAARAMLLAAGARPRAASARTENEQHVTGRLSVAGGPDPEIEAQLREAVALAREVAEPGLLAMTLTRLRTYITSPDTLDERIELTREIVELTAGGRNAVAEYMGQLVRHEDLMESGDLDGARIQARNMRRLGESVNASGIIAIAYSLQATHETADGKLAEARESLRRSSAEEAKQGRTSNTQNRFGSQLLAIRWHQGRIGELEHGFRRALDVFPRMMATRAALAFIYADTEQIDLALSELQVLTEQPVTSIAKDFSWWFTTVFMSLTSIATGSADVARDLYELLLPYAQRNASNAGAVSFGSAALVLALLADFLGDVSAAEAHFEAALAFNIRTRQRTWMAYTRYHYADMLLRRGATGDEPRARELSRIARADAYEIGMTGLLARIERMMDAAGTSR